MSKIIKENLETIKWECINFNDPYSFRDKIVIFPSGVKAECVDMNCFSFDANEIRFRFIHDLEVDTAEEMANKIIKVYSFIKKSVFKIKDIHFTLDIRHEEYYTDKFADRIETEFTVVT